MFLVTNENMGLCLYMRQRIDGAVAFTPSWFTAGSNMAGTEPHIEEKPQGVIWSEKTMETNGRKILSFSITYHIEIQG